MLVIYKHLSTKQPFGNKPTAYLHDILMIFCLICWSSQKSFTEKNSQNMNFWKSLRNDRFSFYIFKIFFKFYSKPLHFFPENLSVQVYFPDWSDKGLKLFILKWKVKRKLFLGIVAPFFCTLGENCWKMYGR